MRPLCKKTYIDKILEIVVLVGGIFLDIFFINNINDLQNSTLKIIFIILFSVLLFCYLVDCIYWIFQPNVLIYQYEAGIVIKRNKRIEYTEIEKVYFKNYIRKKGRRGNYYKDTYSGIIFIQLKSGKVHRIMNAFYPIEAVDTICRIKQQRKFR